MRDLRQKCNVVPVQQVDFKETACQLAAAREAHPTVPAGAVLKDIILERWEQRRADLQIL